MLSFKKNYKLLICIFVSFLFLLIFSTYFIINSLNKDDIAATVNGEPIFEKEIERTFSRYQNTAITRKDIINIAAKEVLVVQEAKKLGITVDDNDLDKKIKTLEEDYPKFYSLAIEQYENIAAYKEALKYKMLYDKVKEKITIEHIKANPVDDETLKQQMIQEGLINEKDFYDSNYENLKIQFVKQNNEQRSKKYFEEWTNSLLNTAEIK